MIVSTHIAHSELDDVFDLDNCLSGFQLTLVFLLLHTQECMQKKEEVDEKTKAN